MKHRLVLIICKRKNKVNISLPIEAKDIQKLIPHRFPFMLIDRITAFESGKSLTALAILTEGGRNPDEIYFFAGIDNARFKRQVIPADQLVFEIELLQSKRGIGKFKAVAKVNGELAVEAEIMCAKRKVEK